jgi:hypothetical protein
MKRMLLVSTALAGAIALQLGMEPPRLANHGSPPYTGAQARSAQGAINIARPNKELTPGAIRTTSKIEICGGDGKKSTNSLRLYNHDKSAFDARASSIFSQYQLERTPIYTLDHLVPLGIGGEDTPTNIWPQPKVQALRKDKLEFWMRDQICMHTDGMSDEDSSEVIKLLQDEIAHDWYKAYQHYLGR